MGFSPMETEREEMNETFDFQEGKLSFFRKIVVQAEVSVVSLKLPTPARAIDASG
jgi:hypothetical protein